VTDGRIESAVPLGPVQGLSRWDRNTDTGEPSDETHTFQSAHQRIFRDGATASRIVLPVIPA
jgi:predicted acyl esterase